MTRFALAFVCLLAAPCTDTASAQVAYVYVQTAKGVNLYDASSTGKLSLVSGSPFQTTGQMIGSNGTHFITLGTDYVHSYPIASNGALKEQVSEINTQSYSDADCGTTAGAVLDHTGQYLYVSLGGGSLPPDSGQGAATSCDALQTFSIGKSSGELTFKGATSFGSVQGSTSFAPLPTFSGNGAFAYEILCCYSDSGDSLLTGFSRESSGALTNSDPLVPDNAPAAQQPGWFYQPVPERLTGEPPPLYPVASATDIAADSTNHLAVLVCPVQPEPSGCWDGTSYPYQLASYTIGSKGQITSTNTWENMPTLPLAASACDDGCPTIGMTISPSGKILAVSVATGVRFFHFNGAEPITEFTGIIGTSGYISSMQWDNSNHLYAVNGASGKLHVYTVTTSSAVEAAGSPYPIGAQGLVVVSK
jgi:WD40 repeat protein